MWKVVIDDWRFTEVARLGRLIWGESLRPTVLLQGARVRRLGGPLGWAHRPISGAMQRKSSGTQPQISLLLPLVYTLPQSRTAEHLARTHQPATGMKKSRSTIQQSASRPQSGQCNDRCAHIQSHQQRPAAPREWSDLRSSPLTLPKSSEHECGFCVQRHTVLSRLTWHLSGRLACTGLPPAPGLAGPGRLSVTRNSASDPSIWSSRSLFRYTKDWRRHRA